MDPKQKSYSNEFRAKDNRDGIVVTVLDYREDRDNRRYRSSF